MLLHACKTRLLTQRGLIKDQPEALNFMQLNMISRLLASHNEPRRTDS